jgi:hypothetical protein
MIYNFTQRALEEDWVREPLKGKTDNSPGYRNCFTVHVAEL